MTARSARSIAMLVLAGAVGGSVPVAEGAAFPTKPITLVVPFPPGEGPTPSGDRSRAWPINISASPSS